MVFADGFALSVCNNPKCGGIHVELSKNSEIVATVVLSPEQAREVIVVMQDLLYEAAVERVK